MFPNEIYQSHNLTSFLNTIQPKNRFGCLLLEHKIQHENNLSWEYKLLKSTEKDSMQMILFLNVTTETPNDGY